MIPLDEDELEGLVEYLRDHPGFITAAVVPGSVGGDALIERLRSELPDLPFEVADPQASPAALGSRAVELGRTAGAVFLLPLDGRRRFKDEDEVVAFWSALNFQREALAHGSVRTCLLLNEETERGLDLVADDLWDWATFFRFPKAHPVPEPGQQPLSEPPRVGDRAVRKEDVEVLRRQWLRARETGIPVADLVENYAGPLFVSLVETGHFDEAVRLWERDLRDGEAVDPLPLAKRLPVLLATIKLARRERREEIVRRSLESYDEICRRHPEDASARMSRAEAFRWLGRLNDAAKDYEEAVGLGEKLGDQAVVADALHSLAMVLQAQGDLSGAREKLERSLAIKASVFGTEEHPSVAASLHELARVLKAQGDLSGAREKLERSLAIWASVFGTEEHPDVAASLHELARVLQAEGDLQGARETFERVLGIEEKIYGTRDHYSTAITEMVLGFLLLQLDEPEDGTALLAHAYGVFLKQLGPEHPYTRRLSSVVGAA